jgi:uncharacterized protein (TIGR03435 family)
MRYMNAKQIVIASVLSAGAVWSQAPKYEFEVASIRPMPASERPQVTIGIRIDGAQVRISMFSFKDYVATAYRVRPYQVSGPSWIDSERYEIAATLPPGTGQAAHVGEMLQSLLADRFQMKVHKEKKEFPVYALEVEKGGLKLQPLPPDPEGTVREAGVNAVGSGSEKGIAVSLGNGAYYTYANNRFEAKKISMAMLVTILERYLDKPFLDQTNVSGNFDLAFDLTEEDYRAMLIRAAVNSGVVLPPQALKALEVGSNASLEAALQKAGLKLVSKKAPLDMVVVDEARKIPTEN